MASSKAFESVLFIVLVIVIAVLGFVYMSSLKPEHALAPETKQFPELPEIEEAIPEEPQKEMSSPSAEIAETQKTLNIEISGKAGYEQKFDIVKGTMVIWTNPTNIRRQVNCYVGDEKNIGYNFFIAYAYEKGDTILYTFNEPGRFMCIGNIYSLKWKFNVVESKTAVTGSAIIGFFKSIFD